MRLKKILPKGKKFTSKALGFFLTKKLPRFFNHFARLYLHLADDVIFSKEISKSVNVVKKTQTFRVYDPFSGLENCWANFKTFSRIQASV